VFLSNAACLVNLDPFEVQGQSAEDQDLHPGIPPFPEAAETSQAGRKTDAGGSRQVAFETAVFRLKVRIGRAEGGLRGTDGPNDNLQKADECLGRLAKATRLSPLGGRSLTEVLSFYDLKATEY